MLNHEISICYKLQYITYFTDIVKKKLVRYYNITTSPNENNDMIDKLLTHWFLSTAFMVDNNLWIINSGVTSGKLQLGDSVYYIPT